MNTKYKNFKRTTLSSIFLLLFSQALMAQVPSDLMRNCDQWKITYPTGSEDKTLCGEANNEFFHLNDSEDGIVFFVPIRSDNGSTANSDYIRSELREREEDGSGNIYWTTEGTHMLYVAQAITHLPIVKSHLVATQIHGNKEDGIDDSMVLRLEDDHLFLSFNGGKLRDDLTITRNYSLGTKHEVIFLVVDGKHYCYYAEDGKLLNAYNDGDAASYLVKDGDNDFVMDLNYDETYFKVGNYTQSNPEREGSSTDDENNYGEVVVYDFLVKHGTESSEPVSVTGITITSSDIDMTEGGTQQINTVIAPVNATDRGLSYSSSNDAIATVNASGEVSAHTAGSVTVTVSTDDGGFTDDVSVTVYAASTGTNLSVGKSVTGTGTPDGSNVPDNLVDGDVDTRWAVSGMPQSATIDLGGTFSIDGTSLVCYEDRAYQYEIEVSTDNGSFTKVVDRTSNATGGSNTAPIIDGFSAVTARYVRITVTGANSYSGSWVSLEELSVFGDESGSSVTAVTSVSFVEESVSLIVGHTLQLSVDVIPANADNQNVSYSSSNLDAVTIDENGLVSALAEGMSSITVTTADGGFTDVIEITVEAEAGGGEVLSADVAIDSTQPKLYPNPSNSIVNINAGENFDSLSIYDYAGLLLSVVNLNEQGLQSIDVSVFKSGLYIFRLTGKKESSIHRIAVK